MYKTTKGTLEGFFKNNKLNGKGVFLWNDEEKLYKGSFKNSKFEGEGKMYFEKTIWHAKWENNKREGVTREEQY